MFDSVKKKLFADPYSAPSLIRRLFAEYGIGHWRAYAFVIAMMSIMAASTAAGAYLIGHAVDEAYVSRNMTAVVSVCIGMDVVFSISCCSRAWHSLLTGTRRNSRPGSPGVPRRRPTRSIRS